MGLFAPTEWGSDPGRDTVSVGLPMPYAEAGNVLGQNQAPPIYLAYP